MDSITPKLAAELYLDMKAWLKESAAKSATPFDDMAVNFVDQLDVAILPQIDKINGKKGKEMLELKSAY